MIIKGTNSKEAIGVGTADWNAKSIFKMFPVSAAGERREHDCFYIFAILLTAELCDKVKSDFIQEACNISKERCVLFGQRKFDHFGVDDAVDCLNFLRNSAEERNSSRTFYFIGDSRVRYQFNTFVNVNEFY